MDKEPSALSVQLFYSYSHRDARYRERMETALKQLQRQGLLSQWADLQIMAGQSISKAIEDKIASSDIIVYLLSADFIDSDECNREWQRGQDLGSGDRNVFRIPIVLRECAWLDFLADDDVKALPTDGKPISSYPDEDAAWQEVYEGIKAVVEHIRRTFAPKPSFLAEIQHTDFTSDTPLALEDVFTFPLLTLQPSTDSDNRFSQRAVSSIDELLALKRCLLHGPDKSGKTALARSLHLSLVNTGQPTLLVDLSQIQARLTDATLRSFYSTQFSGDYSMWKQQPHKTLILDNLTEAPRLVDDIQALAETFTNIYITLSSDNFSAYYKDDTRLAEYHPVHIEPLTHVQQEELIRKRLRLLANSPELQDGFVDNVEDRVNSIIISNRVVPRYPFFVLSILQTYESFMPRNIPITSYGHCYYVLIIASLTQTGISDGSVNSALNFAEKLAFARYSYDPSSAAPFSFQNFIVSYRERFHIDDSVVNRLQNRKFGILNQDGGFRVDYMYYFFLGKYLASNTEQNRDIINRICENSHSEPNYLTLLFTIHHATDDRIIEDILQGTACALESISPATLDRNETRRFSNIVSELPDNILSQNSVESERRKERQNRDKNGGVVEENREPESSGEDLRLQLYRILKNNAIMGQVLRNRYGNLEKPRIEEIIEVVVDGSLRIVNAILKDEDEIAKLASYLAAHYPEEDVEKIRQFLRFISLVWTITHIEQAVDSINVPEISESLRKVVGEKGTPSYDLVGYFSEIDSARELTTTERDSLVALWDKHTDPFIRWLLSARTQMYMNTHRSRTSIEQSICSALGIKYTPRLLNRG